MVAEVHEVDVEELRRLAREDKDVCYKLWHDYLLPDVLLLVKANLEFPQFIIDREWKQVQRLLRKYAEIKVLDAGETILLPAGGIVLQGMFDQIEVRAGTAREEIGQVVGQLPTLSRAAKSEMPGRLHQKKSYELDQP